MKTDRNERKRQWLAAAASLGPRSGVVNLSVGFFTLG